MRTQIVKTGNLNIELPIIPLKEAGISIILFDSFKDTSLTPSIAQEAVNTFTKPDIMVCPEVKALPLCIEMARLWNIEYFVLRKTQKIFMTEPLSIKYYSITSKGEQKLWYDAKDAAKLQGKKVMLFDDVISTGGTLKAMLDFAQNSKLQISSIATIYVEGDLEPLLKVTEKYNGIEHLGRLPILPLE